MPVEDKPKEEAHLEEEFQINEKLINEEYKIWKKQSPFLYDVLVSKALKWPSLTVQWLPESAKSDYYSTWSLLLGTNTFQNDHDYVQVAKVDLPHGDHTGTILNKIDVTQQIDHEGEVNKARYSPLDPNLIATLTPSGDTLVFDRNKLPEHSESHLCTPEYRLKHHTKEGWALSWAPHYRGQLLTGTEDGTIALWDVSQGQPEGPKTVISEHTSYVNDVQWSATTPHVFGSAGEDLSIRIFDTRSLQKSVHSYDSAHSEAVNGIHFNPFNEYVFASASSDDTVNIWDLRRPGVAIYTLRGHSADVSSVQWSPHDESVLASSGSDRRINIWDLSLMYADQTSQEEQEGPPELLFIHGGHTNKISDFSWHPAEPWVVASASEDNVVQVWKVASAIVDHEPEVEQEQE